jgi:hypothetical protein
MQVVKFRFSEHSCDLSVDVFLGPWSVDGYWPKHKGSKSSGLFVDVPGYISGREESHEAFFADLARPFLRLCLHDSKGS